MNSSKDLNTRKRTVSIPVLNAYQVETMERMANDPENGRLFPAVVPDSITDHTSRLAIASALKDINRLKALGLLRTLGQSEGLDYLALTEKGHLLFNVEHERSRGIQ